MSCLEQVRDALLTVTENCGHYEAVNETDRYIVWAEDNEFNDFSVNNFKNGQTVEGTIDYFTKHEDDENIEKIPLALNKAKIYWKINSIQYEEETQFIHYEWVFRVRQMYGEDGDQGA